MDCLDLFIDPLNGAGARDMISVACALLSVQAFKYVIDSLKSELVGLACLKRMHIAIFSRC